MSGTGRGRGGMMLDGEEGGVGVGGGMEPMEKWINIKYGSMRY